jgi:hypothetical protein
LQCGHSTLPAELIASRLYLLRRGIISSDRVKITSVTVESQRC